MTQTTIYLLSGNAQTLIKHHQIAEDARIIPFSEKQILTIGKTISMLRADTSEVVFFAAKSLSLQRYHQILKGMMLLAGVKRGALVDELGIIERYSPFRVIFVDSFRLLFEIIASVWVIVSAWTELFLLRSVRK